MSNDPDSSSLWHVRTLGPRNVLSPLGLSRSDGGGWPNYVRDDARVFQDIQFVPGQTTPDLERSFEKAGPREHIFFEPPQTRVGILTCGGLCPGINHVLRSLVLQLFHKYGVRHISGFRYGYAGLDPKTALPPIALTPDEVRHIHMRGGTILGTSRGEHDIGTMVDSLQRQRIDVLFTIGGDGTMRGAHAIAEEARRRNYALSVIGIPKTIDNDIAFVDKTFGFESAVAVAREAIDAAHTEAVSADRGIGLVKLMGRGAGFIAAYASLASHEVNLCLVPEIPFELEGPTGVLAYLEQRLYTRGHAVVVVAEGCGQRLVTADPQSERAAPKDASGNLRFGSPSLDIGTHLKGVIQSHFEKKGVHMTLKYIDPSYMIRGVPARALDAVFCDELARVAVHAAMAGKTDMMVGRLHRVFTHVPLPLTFTAVKRIDPNKELWLSVLETTGQPPSFTR